MLNVASNCVVHPKEVVVGVGQNVSLNCRAEDRSFVANWRKGADLLDKADVYLVPVYRRNGTIHSHSPRFIAPGYSVDDTKENQVILFIVSANRSQAGTYYCTCSDDKLSVGEVAVIETKFSQANDRFCSEKLIMLTCSISSSTVISYMLEIYNTSGNTVAAQNGSSLCGAGQTSCALNYIIPVNAFNNQSFSCTVDATTTKNLQFSTALKLEIEYSIACSGEPLNIWLYIVVLGLLPVILIVIVCMVKRGTKTVPRSDRSKLLCSRDHDTSMK